jgi:hypothetical protein
VACGVISVLLMAQARTGFRRLEAAAKQVLVLQDAQIQLTRADALATSAFLQGGLPSDAALAALSKDIQSANANLAVITRGVGGAKADGALASLTDYLAGVTAAQANNRQNNPVGATYQLKASTLMSDMILNQLRDVDTSARAEVQRQSDNIGIGQAGPWVLLVGSLLALAFGTRELSSKFHRTLNVGILASAAVIAVALLLASSAIGTARQNSLDRLRFEFRGVDVASQALVSLQSARSSEALTLIKRGSGESYEQEWKQAAADAVQATEADLRAGNATRLLQNYRTLHADMRQQDDAGDWDGARVRVLPDVRSERDDVLRAFTAAEAELLRFRALDDPLSKVDGSNGILRAQIIVLLGSLVAAALARAGYQQRVREYR